MTSPPQQAAHRRGVGTRAIGFLFAGMALLLLGACAAPGAASSAARREQATPFASPTPAPAVTVRLMATQSGSVAGRDLTLTVAITVENHTSQTISLYGTCQQQAILISLAPQGSGQPPMQLGDAVSCPLGAGGSDLRPAVPAASAQTYRQTIVLFSWGSNWTAGPYTMSVSIPAWSQPGPTGLSGAASGEMTITLS